MQSANKKKLSVKKGVLHSPAFKDWFDGSVVVDKNKLPLVVYHGTATEITEFKYDYVGLGNDQNGSGFYFTTDESEANGYEVRPMSGKQKIGDTGNPNTIKAYLRITNPLTPTTPNKATRKQIERMLTSSPKLDDALQNYGDVEYEGRGFLLNTAIDAIYDSGYDELLRLINIIGNDFYKGEERSLLEHTRKIFGYDGVEVTFEDKKHFIAWFPSQIKSVDNIGTFNINNPDIRFEKGGSISSPTKFAKGGGKVLVKRKKETSKILLAPNGAMSNLSPTLHKLVRTPQFINFFGDWINDPQNASKVLDINGEPLVVWHGGADTITTFDERFGGETTANNEYGAFFFTNKEQVAEDYSRQAIIRRYQDRSEDDLSYYKELTKKDIKNILDDLESYAESKLKVYPVFLNMRDLYIDDSYKEGILDTEKTQRLINYVKNGVYSDYEFTIEDETYSQSDINDYKEEIERRAREDNGLEEDEEIEEWQFSQAVRDVLEENSIYPEIKTYDGILIKSVTDDIGANSNITQDEYIAIKPNQIKLADGSNKTFYSSNDDIRYNGGGSFKSAEAITFDNFYSDTFANFQKIPFKEKPKRKPDFISNSGSKYWNEGNYVVRMSNHWCRMDSCNWLLNGSEYKGFALGKCKLSDFKRLNNNDSLEENKIFKEGGNITSSQYDKWFLNLETEDKQQITDVEKNHHLIWKFLSLDAKERIYKKGVSMGLKGISNPDTRYDGGEAKRSRGEIRKEADRLLDTLASLLLRDLNSDLTQEMRSAVNNVNNANFNWDKDVVFSVQLKKKQLMESADKRLEGRANLVNSSKINTFTPTKTNNELQSILSGNGKVSNGAAIQSAARYLRRSEGASPLDKDSKLSKIQEEQELIYAIDNNSQHDTSRKSDIGNGTTSQTEAHYTKGSESAGSPNKGKKFYKKQKTKSFDNGGDVDIDTEKLVLADANTAEFKKWFSESKFKDRDGNPIIYYHQTRKENLKPIEEYGFDLNILGARESDDQMPNGVFIKKTDQDIQVGGSPDEIVQIPVYVRAENPIYFDSRIDLGNYLSGDDAYRVLKNKIDKIDKDRHEEFELLWKEKSPYERGTEEHNADFKAKNQQLKHITDEWKKEIRTLATLARERVTEIFKSEGYDAVVVRNDEGSFGRSTWTLVVFEPNQVKSAVNNWGSFDINQNGIKYGNGGNMKSQNYMTRQMSNQPHDEEAAKEIRDLYKQGKSVSEAIQVVKNRLRKEHSNCRHDPRIGEGLSEENKKDLRERVKHGDFDIIHGGLSDKATLEDIAKMHNVPLSQIEAEHKKGINVEMEHTDNPKIASEISKDHVYESPIYYTELAKMEKRLESKMERGGELNNYKIIPNEQTPKTPRILNTKKFIKEHKEELNEFLSFASSIPNAEALAANQVSLNGKRLTYRAFALNSTFEWKLIVNPRIDEYIGDKEEKTERCLSWKEKKITAQRSPKVKVSYYTIDGNKVEGEEHSGLQAQVWQHEVDHLNGVEMEVSKISVMESILYQHGGKILDKKSRNSAATNEKIKDVVEDLYEDHWETFAFAEKMAKTTDKNAAENSIIVLNKYYKDMKPHFQEEEELFPKIKDGSNDYLIEEIIKEHREFESIIDQIENSGTTTAERIVNFGNKVMLHVQKEDSLFGKYAENKFLTCETPNMKTNKVKDKLQEMTNGKEGGQLVGKAHSECNEDGCGIQAVVSDAGGKRHVELEAEEIIITKPAVLNKDIITITGTPKEILSTINHKVGGGVPIGKTVDYKIVKKSKVDRTKAKEITAAEIADKWRINESAVVTKMNAGSRAESQIADAHERRELIKQNLFNDIDYYEKVKKLDHSHMAHGGEIVKGNSVSVGDEGMFHGGAVRVMRINPLKVYYVELDENDNAVQSEIEWREWLTADANEFGMSLAKFPPTPVPEKDAILQEGGELYVAEEIRKQIGKQALMMLGAKDLAGDKNSLSFKIRGSKAFNYIKITLTPLDQYDIEFIKIWGYNVTKKKEIKGIEVSQLLPVIEKETGLYTKLECGGELPEVSTELNSTLEETPKFGVEEQELMVEALEILMVGEVDESRAGEYKEQVYQIRELQSMEMADAFEKGGLAGVKKQDNELIVYESDAAYITKNDANYPTSFFVYNNNDKCIGVVNLALPKDSKYLDLFEVTDYKFDEPRLKNKTFEVVFANLPLLKKGLIMENTDDLLSIGKHLASQGATIGVTPSLIKLYK